MLIRSALLGSNGLALDEQFRTAQCRNNTTPSRFTSVEVVQCSTVLSQRKSVHNGS